MSALPATLPDRKPRLSAWAPRRLYLSTHHTAARALCTRLIVAWLVLRTLAWALAAATQPNPPLDTVEWLAWGHEWQLGYHKHPPLAAWVADLAWRLVLDSMVFQAEAELRWLDHCESSLIRYTPIPRPAGTHGKQEEEAKR